MKRIDLNKYIFPSRDIVKAFQSLDEYYQIIRGNNKDNSNLSDSHIKPHKDLRLQTHDYNRDELYHKHSGKPWEVFVKSIFLMSNTPDALDLTSISGITKEQFSSLYSIINDGLKAYQTISKWLEPLTETENPNALLKAMYDALDISIRAGGQNFNPTFRMFKVADLPHYKKTGSPVLYNSLLEVKDPQMVIDYLVNRQEVFDQLLVTYWVHPDERNYFTLYMIYDGSLYVFLHHPSSKNMHMISIYRSDTHKIHLPKKMVDRVKERALIDPSYDVHQITTFDEVEKYHPDVIYWLDMFLIHAIYAIERDKNIIKKAVTPSSQTPLLADKTIISYETYKFRRENGRNQYLEAILGDMPLSDQTSIAEHSLGMVNTIDTPENIADQRAFETRRIYANWMQAEINKHYEANHERVYAELTDLFKAQGVKTILEKAVRHDLHFGEDVVSEMMSDVFFNFTQKHMVLWHPKHQDGDRWLHNYNYEKASCPICDNKKWVYSIEITFTDYRQIASFLKIEESKLPLEVVNHLHQKSNVDIENDVSRDPVEAINDPWFKKDWRSNRNFKLMIVSCSHCMKEAKKKGGKVFTPTSEMLENYKGWMSKSSRSKIKHFWVSNPLGGGCASLCGKEIVQSPNYPSIGASYRDLESYKQGTKKTHCHHCVKALETLLKNQNAQKINIASHLVTKEMTKMPSNGWGFSNATGERKFDGAKAIRHFFINTKLTLCGTFGTVSSGYVAYPKSSDHDDEDYRNCPNCLEVLQIIKTKGKVVISGRMKFE